MLQKYRPTPLTSKIVPSLTCRYLSWRAELLSVMVSEASLGKQLNRYWHPLHPSYCQPQEYITIFFICWFVKMYLGSGANYLPVTCNVIFPYGLSIFFPRQYFESKLIVKWLYAIGIECLLYHIILIIVKLPYAIGADNYS